MLQILLALIAGILTIAAPCILLPLPILLGSSVGQKSKTRPLFITLGFVITFAILGIALNFLVQNLGLNPNTLRTVAVVLLALFAVFMIWPTPFEKLTQHMSGLINRAAKTGQAAGTGNAGGFVMGVVIGVIWAPCAGPILGSILTLIAQESNTIKALGLLVAYAIGAGIPMLLIAYGGQAITGKIRFIAQYATRLQQVFGVILLLLAVAIHFQYDTLLQAKLLTRFPFLNGGIESKVLCQVPGYIAQGDECNQKDNGIPVLEKPATAPKAPEFAGISHWLNTDRPLTISELKGKVVLIDFWTYSCINCIRTLPYVTKLYDTYKDKGLVVVGVHTPEFPFEKDTSNVARAIQQHSIHYPVAQDNDFSTWTAYGNHYWPAEYLIDQNGSIVYTHFGEGKYDQTEMAIKQLLGLSGGATVDSGSDLSQVKSPEMYFGYERVEFLANGRGQSDEQEYVIPNRLDLNKFALSGTWKLEADKAVLVRGVGKIKLHFKSAKVHMVASSPKPGGHSITVRVDNYPATILNVSNADLYTVFDSTNYGDHVLEITIPDAGFEAFTFTFG